MRDILPPAVIDTLRDRYLAGVADAEANFWNAVGDEDSLTGALGQAVSNRSGIVVAVEGAEYTVKIRWDKLRGNGPRAPESLYGPDGIFQIEILNERGQIVRTKGLPFQAKTGWKGTNSELAKQCSAIERSLAGGIVVNYTANGYEACTTEAAYRFKGKYGLAKQAGEIQPLGQLLANDFLNCTKGSVGLFFDRRTERFYGDDGRQIAPATAITTSITRRISDR